MEMWSIYNLPVFNMIARRKVEEARYKTHIKDMEAARYAANMRNTAPLQQQQARNNAMISEMNERNSCYDSSTDLLNPLNVLSPLSPFNPMHTMSESSYSAPEQTRHDSCSSGSQHSSSNYDHTSSHSPSYDSGSSCSNSSYDSSSSSSSYD